MKRQAPKCTAAIALLIIVSLFGAFQEGTFASPAKAKRSTSSSKSSKARKSTASTKSSKNTARRSGKSSRSTRGTVARNSARGRKSMARARARAVYLARVRAIHARDYALRAGAVANISRDVIQGEDIGIRRVAIDALAGRSGTVVVMDPNTGRIYTIVNQTMALGSPVKPCSTVKMIVGLGALHEGVFDPNQAIQLSRYKSLNLADAIAHSDNTFFQNLGRRLGYERVMQYATNFGFGAPTGVNYPGEDTGFLPEPGEEETGHMSSHGDGFGVTAIQLAAFTAAVANGGNLYVPRVPRTQDDAMNFVPQLKRKIDMAPEDRLRMLAGMCGAVNFGTAKLAYDPAGQVAGKTGTCTGSRDKLGLFTSFSSVDNPKLIVTVVTTGSTEAGKRAAEIAGRVYRAISPAFLRDQRIAPAAASIEVQTPRNEEDEKHQQ